MAASFAAFLTAQDRDEVVLLELTGRLIVSLFTAVGGGAPNTYKLTLVKRELAGDVEGGVYRTVEGVRENATDLTAQTSLATVDANPGSWWYDEATETLSVHSTTGAGPDTFTTYQALVRFYFATKPVLLNKTAADADTGRYYLPWLLGDLPELVERDDELIFGAKSTQGGSIQLLNGHEFWHTVVARDGSYRWKHGQATFFLGGSYDRGREILTRAQYGTLMTMQIEDVAADEHVVEFELKPLSRRLVELIPKTPYFSSTYPNLGEGVEGAKKWVGYGRTTMRPDLTDTSSHGVYTIADEDFQTLFAVNSLWAVSKTTGVKTLLTVTTHYTVNLTTCTVTIVDVTYKWQDYLVEIDVSGKPDGAGSYLKTAADIVKDILTTCLDVRATDIDTAAFTQAALDGPDEISLWIKSPRSVASILATAQDNFPALERSAGGLLFQTAAGQWVFDVWDPRYDLATLDTLRKTEFTVFRPQPKVESIFPTVQVHYNFNHATGAWAVHKEHNLSNQYENDTTDVMQVYTYLREVGAATRLAQRLLVSRQSRQGGGGSVLEVDVEELGARLATKRPRERLLIDFDPAPVAAGALAGSAFEIEEIRRTFTPRLKVSAILGNLRGIGELIGRWTDSSAPDYSAATPTERAASGYWSDSSGFVVPGNPTTKDISRWW